MQTQLNKKSKKRNIDFRSSHIRTAPQCHYLTLRTTAWWVMCQTVQRQAAADPCRGTWRKFRSRATAPLPRTSLPQRRRTRRYPRTTTGCGWCTRLPTPLSKGSRRFRCTHNPGPCLATIPSPSHRLCLRRPRPRISCWSRHKSGRAIAILPISRWLAVATRIRVYRTKLTMNKNLLFFFFMFWFFRNSKERRNIYCLIRFCKSDCWIMF